MDQVGTDFAASGSVLSRQELENQRRKRGECVTCGRKCFQKKLFKLIPITEPGQVLDGRCLKCKPIDIDQQNKPVSSSKPTTREDMLRFAKSQSNLHLSGPGIISRSERERAISSSRRPNRSSSVSQDGGYRNNPGRQWSSQSGSGQSVSSEESQGSSREFTRSLTAHNSTDTLATAPPSLGNASLNYSQHSSHGRQNFSARDDFGSSQHGSCYGQQNGAGLQEYDAFVPTPVGRRQSGESLSSMRSAIEERDSRRRLDEDSYSYHGHAQVVATTPLSQYIPDVHPQQLYHDVNTSQRSVHSHLTADATMNPYQRSGVLNRGGQISFNNAAINISNSGSNRSLRSHHSSRSARNSAHGFPINASRLQSTRSLESMNSFGEEDHNHLSVMHDSRRRGSGDKPIIGTRQRLGEELSLSHHSDASRKPNYRQYSSRQLAAHDNSQNSSSILTQNSSLLSVTVASRESSGLDRLHIAGADLVEIVHVLREFHDSSVVQATALQQLSIIDMNEQDSNRFALAGGIDMVVEAMRQHPMDIDIQTGGCRATWNASGTAANQLTFVDAGALDVILLAMGQFLADVVLQEQAMAALANLGAAELNVETMIERGAVAAIVEAMNKHADNIHVQMKGCAAITNMASHMSPLKQVIMDAGGGGAVVIAMVMHPDDFFLQERALRALRNLSANCEHNKIELATMGGIDAVISAMQVHRDAAGVQEAGAWTLSNLAGNAENKVLIGEYGGIDVTIRAMWVHSEDVKVQEWCCRALFSLSLDIKNGELIREVGGVSAVVNAMQAHVDRSVIQEIGCAVLCNLATDDVNKKRIVDEEALDAIVLGMVIHCDDVKVQERACQVLLQLAILENCKAMQASNVGALVATAAENFPKQCANLADLFLRSLENFAAEYNQVHAAA